MAETMAEIGSPRRVRFSAAQLSRVRFASRPDPLRELDLALLALFSPDRSLVLAPWRQQVLHRLPPSTGILRDLVPAGAPPAFLDVTGDSLAGSVEAMRATGGLVRREIERTYAMTRPPQWIRDLHQDAGSAWQTLARAEAAAFAAVVGPSWSLVEELHHAEFARYAVAAAERGVGPALSTVLPGRPCDGGWEMEARPGPIPLAGDGDIVLLPTFHGIGAPIVGSTPDGRTTIVYPAPGLVPVPARPAADTESGLAQVLGRSRLELLRQLSDGPTTNTLAARLRLSPPTVSGHTAALRAAGLLTTTRAGRSVRHRRTPLADLLIRRIGG